MNKLQNYLKELNNASYKNIKDLEIGQKYRVHNIEIVNTKFGKRMRVKCDGNIQFYLPESWNDKFTTDCLNAINKSTAPVSIMYNGLIDLPNGNKKHEIVLSVDEGVE